MSLIRFDNVENLERINEMPTLKAQIISHLFSMATQRQRDVWWKYKGDFIYEGNPYDLECELKWDNQMFTYRNLHISHKQTVVDLENKDDIAKYFGEGALDD